MPHSILFAVERPTEARQERDYQNTIGRLSELAQQHQGIQLLGENVVLTELEGNIFSLSMIVKSVIAGLNYKYAIFDQTIEWSESP